MGRRKYNQGRLDDYTGADMVDPKTRRQALDDYIGRTGWKMTQVQRSEMVNAACAMADKQIATQAEQAERKESGRSAGSASRLSAPGESSQAEPLTERTAWKAWV